MKKFALICALTVWTVGSATAATPTRSVGPFGPSNPLDSGRDICFSQPPDLEGWISSSEIIGAYGLEVRIADDFSLDADRTICLARWWGGYYNNDNGCADNEVATFNLYFYENGECLPTGEPISAFTVTPRITPIGCQNGYYPMYAYEATISQPVSANVRYWFVAQAGDHAFPPQWGRLSAGHFVIWGCESAFWSPYFGYPDWTTYDSGIFEPVDFSQEFECDCQPVPSSTTTWGAVRALYR
jgi:hypothetical protein